MSRRRTRSIAALAASVVAIACGGGDRSARTFSTNVAFVTSTKYDANLGGIAGADAKCQARASAAGLPGTYVAWISDGTTDAYCHLHGFTGKKAANCGQTELPVAAGPWIRTDGTAFAPTIDKLAANPHIVYTPLIYDELGQPFPTRDSMVFTSTNWEGVFAGGGSYTACADWTDSSTAILATGGWVYGTFGTWTNGWGLACNQKLPLICMQVGSGKPLPTVTPTGKVAFVTSTTYTGDLGGVAGADAKCQTRATAAGLANASKFKAWLSDSTHSAISRLSGNGPWSRLDGYTVANDKTDLTDGMLFAPIEQTEQGTYWNLYAWTGTDASGAAVTDTCNDWIDGTSGYQGVIGSGSLASELWTNYTGVVCSDTRPLYCFEDE
jgi:hypothetical protein